MKLTRAFWKMHAQLALLLLLCALAVRALVPQGYMVSSGPMTLSVTVCLDGINQETIDVAVPMDGKDGDHDNASDAPCAYTALSMAGLAGADPVLLADALSFVLRTDSANVVGLALRDASHIRPPLRGPPTRN